MLKNKRFLYPVLFLCMIAGVLFFTRDKTIHTPYEYPVRPGSAQWQKFESRSEMVDACQIPQDILDNLSTQALLETILDYPLLSDMTTVSHAPEGQDDEAGFRHIAGSFNGLQEFMSRTDALSTLHQDGDFDDSEVRGGSIYRIIYQNTQRCQSNSQ